MKNNLIVFDLVLLVVSLGICIIVFQKSFGYTYDKIEEQAAIERQAELDAIEAEKALEE